MSKNILHMHYMYIIGLLHAIIQEKENKIEMKTKVGRNNNIMG